MVTNFLSSAKWLLCWMGLWFAAAGFLFPAQARSAENGASFEYLFPHLPSTVGQWEATLVIMNPGYDIVEARVEAYQQATDSSAEAYVLEHSLHQSLLPYQALDITSQLPSDSGDRWVRVSSDQRLTGWIQFRQKQNPNHQTTLPLQPIACANGSRLFPHVPRDRAQFWSGFALVNLGEATPVNFQLWSQQGENLNHLINPGQQGLFLPENGKRLALFEGELFDDRASSQKVAWISVEGGADLQAMMLFGNQQASNLGDLAGVDAQLSSAMATQYRFGLGPMHGDVNGFVLVNPHQDPLTLNLQLFDVSGNLTTTHTATLQPREKRLALWTDGDFSLQGETASSLLSGEQAANLGMFAIEGSQAMIALQLGFQSNGQIEGVKALASATHVATPNFSQTHGQFVLHNQSDTENVVNFWGITPSGVRMLSQQWRLKPNETLRYELSPSTLPLLSYFLASAEAPVSLQWQSGVGEPLTKLIGHPAAPANVPPNPQDLTIPPDPSAIPVRDVWANWVRNETKPLASLTANTFEDLQFLHDAIGTRSLVQLGESSHGAREFNQAKVRIIKFLHQQMGFNVVAFESGFFECETAVSPEITAAATLMRSSIFAVWETEEVAELFDYILQTQATTRPLKLTGFDHQLSSVPGSRKRGDRLYEALAPLDLALAEQIRHQEHSWARRSFDTSFLSENAALLTPLYRQGLETVQAFLDQNPAGTQIPKNQALLLKGSFLAMQTQIEVAGTTGFEYGVLRDKAMADILGFLAKEVYPQEKIAVWAHNAHIMYQSEALNLFGPIRRMGSYLETPFRESLYTVGLYMYRGESADNTRRPAPVQPPDRENSLEAILHTAGKPYLFVDLLNAPAVEGNTWMTQERPPIRAWYWGGPGYEAMVLKNHYDAILFIDETQVPRYLR